MVWVLLSIALGNVALGFYLGTLLWPSFDKSHSGSETNTAVPQQIPPAVAASAACAELETQNAAPVHDSKPANKKTPAAAGSRPETSTETNIHQDIATLNERIRYSLTANDKQLARMIAAELQARIPPWQKQLEATIAASLVELERNPAANIDCAAPELCLAQTETLQTNLALLDWSSSTESILKKLEREIDAVKHLLPTKC